MSRDVVVEKDRDEIDKENKKQKLSVEHILRGNAFIDELWRGKIQGKRGRGDIRMDVE